MTRFHAFLPASGAPFWSQCPMWPHMNAKYPVPPDDDTRLGEAAHWALHELWFVGNEVKAGDVDPTGHPITADMLYDLRKSVEVLKSNAAEVDEVIAEEYLACPSIHPRNGGSPDAVMVDRKNRKMFVHDFKYGHLSVAAEQNWQLINYACAALDDMDEDGSDWEFHFYIHQPRDFTRAGAGGIKYWKMPPQMIRANRNILHTAAQKVFVDKLEYRAGEHCRDCPGRTACPANQAAGHNIIRAVAVGSEAALMPDQIGREYKMLCDGEAFLRSRRRALEDAMKVGIRKGESGYGYSLESTESPLRWTKPAAEVAKLALMHGVDIRKPVDVLTPTQALRAGLSKETVDPLAARFKGDPELVPTKETRAYKAFTSNPINQE